MDVKLGEGKAEAGPIPEGCQKRQPKFLKQETHIPSDKSETRTGHGVRWQQTGMREEGPACLQSLLQSRWCWPVGVAGRMKIQGGDRLHLLVGLGATAASLPLACKADLLTTGSPVSRAVWGWRDQSSKN